MALADLILLPLAAPLWGIRFVLARLRDEADAVQHDEGRMFAELAELSRRRQTGQISEAEFEEEETALLNRLRTIREQREESLEEEPNVEDGWIDMDAEVVEMDAEVVEMDAEVVEEEQ